MAIPAILYPLLLLVLLTFVVVFWMGALRIGAMRRGEVSPRYFKLNTGEIPDLPAQAANHFRNLFELPVLFYTLVALLLVTERADGVQLTLAWLFVASRYVHSLIHLSYNNVSHRFFAFLVGVVTLLAMWVRYALSFGA